MSRVLGEGDVLEEQAGTGAERAAARGLADLTLRRLGQIDAVLGKFVDRKPKGPGQAILQVMAAELLFAGTAPHAAVDTAVRVAQSGRGTSRLAGLINAVGRRISEGGADIVAKHDAARLNAPDWLWSRLKRDWGAETARAIVEAHLVPAPHDLSLANSADCDALAAELGARTMPTGSLRLPDRPQISTLPGYEAGAWWVQDAAAAIPARLLGVVNGKTALDLCAAPGGKTLQLAAAGAQVTALDISEDRLVRLRENLDRCGQTAEVVAADLMEWAPGRTFDAVLLDAPCSATGTIRRHPDLPRRGDGRGIDRLAESQAAMLDSAAKLTAPGGRLVYCTCSMVKAEGEAQVTPFLERNPEFALDPIQREEVPSDLLTMRGTLRTRPDQWAEFGGLDGFFAARFTRRL